MSEYPDELWRPLSDTAWLDGRDLVLLAQGMEVEARYCPGEWSNDTPFAPAEYSGAVWSCFDDKFQLEIEETSENPAEWVHDGATHWRDLSPRPEIEKHKPVDPLDALVDTAVLYLGECIAPGGAKHSKIRRYLTHTLIPALTALSNREQADG